MNYRIIAPMRRALFAVIFACSFQASADDHDPWTDADTIRQSVYVALVVTDVRQTIRYLDSDPSHEEANPIIGKRPSHSRIIGLAAAAVVIDTAIAYYLPRKYRGPFQYVSIGIEGAAVAYNSGHLGLRIGGGF